LQVEHLKAIKETKKINVKHIKKMRKKQSPTLSGLTWLRKSTISLSIKLIAIAMLMPMFRTFASNTYGMDIQFTLKMENVPMKRVLRSIEEQTEFTFVYNSKLVDVEQKVNIDVTDRHINEVLNQLFAGTNINYEIVDRHILLSKKNVDNEILAQQQQITVRGQVRDAQDNPLPGVTVVVKGTTQGTITDTEGRYSLPNVPNDAILVFSFVGMQTQEIPVENRQQIDVVMEEEIIALEEVVAIGYGTQRKADVTSAISSVRADDFIKGNVKDIGQLIQGKVAGLTVVNPSGDPTQNTEVILRGNTTLLGSSISPLVLIDGVPGDLKTVAPQDIESIDVLKDGSAAAIYGTRGTNGVILITTRRATGDYKSSLEINSHFNVQTIARKLNLSDANDFRQQIKNGFRDPNTDLGHSTNWLDEITRTPFSQVHNITYRGGNAKTNYLLNVNYNSSEGVFLKSFNQDLKGRADINHNMFDDKLKFNLSILGSDRKLNGFNGYIYRQATIQNPTAPVKDENGNWFQELTKFEYENPVSDLMESNGLTRQHLTRFNANIIFNPINQLKLSAVLSYSKWNENGGYSETKQHVSTLRDNRNGYASIGASESFDKLAEVTAEYSDVIENHRFTALTGYSYQENNYTSMSMENWDFPTDQFGYYNIGLGEATKDGRVPNPQNSYHAETNLIGFFGRISYSYADRYLFMGSLRHEGASQLWGTNNEWGTFPAVSFGWRLTEEPFMANQKLFTNIKLRLGYGVTGSVPSDLFRGVGLLGYSDYILSNGKWMRTLVPIQNPNPDLKWEEKHETNFGIDFSMLNNRISGNIDYYVRKVNDLLFDYAVPSPPNLYPTTRANVGKMENRGIEIMINFTPFDKKEFGWTSGISFSTNKNKLVSLSNDLYQVSTDYFTTGYTGPPVQTFTHIVKIGDEIGNFYGFKVIDICDDENDMANYGQWIYEDADGNAVKYSDFKHSFEDKKVIGNGLPNYYIGWSNNFRYKNWDLSITMRGAFDFQIANMQRMMYENPTYIQYNLLKSAFDPVFGKTLLQSPHEFNSYYIEDGDYWKIDNIMLGFTIPKINIKYIQSARIYLSSLNTLIITRYKGIDPEVSLVPPGTSSQSGININSGVGLCPGIDNRDKYPTTRTFTLGFNITF